MLTSAAIVPAAPVLVPEVAQGAAPETDDCRQAIDMALGEALSHGPHAVVVVGAGTGTRQHDGGSLGSLASVGVDLRTRLGDGLAHASKPGLPLALTLGAWMLRRAGWSGPVSGLEVAADEDPLVCRALGTSMADDPAPLALVVVADGTARRGPKAPGYTDERAGAFDDAWVRAVVDGDVAGLAAIDPATAVALMMAGRSPLQVLAGAAGTAPCTAHLHYRDDPYGVQYLVATWLRPDG
jgi:hypothetical protein